MGDVCLEAVVSRLEIRGVDASMRGVVKVKDN